MPTALPTLFLADEVVVIKVKLYLLFQFQYWFKTEIFKAHLPAQFGWVEFWT